MSKTAAAPSNPGFLGKHGAALAPASRPVLELPFPRCCGCRGPGCRRNRLGGITSASSGRGGRGVRATPGRCQLHTHRACPGHALPLPFPTSCAVRPRGPQGPPPAAQVRGGSSVDQRPRAGSRAVAPSPHLPESAPNNPIGCSHPSKNCLLFSTVPQMPRFAENAPQASIHSSLGTSPRPGRCICSVRTVHWSGPKP